MTKLYPFLSGCGTVANHPLVHWMAGKPTGDAWALVEGGKLSVSMDDYVGRAAYYVGDLDRKISAIIDRFVEPGDTVLDIGANIGLVSLRLSKRVGPKGVVHAFEPNPAVSRRLVSSLAENGISNVILHEVALGDRPSTLPLSIPKGNAGMGSLRADFPNGHTIQVPVRPLDEFSLGPVSFVKIDVEGFEADVFRGFEKTLATNPPRAILFEQNDVRGESIPILNQAGYRIYGVSKSLLKLTLRVVSAWSPAYHDYLAVK